MIYNSNGSVKELNNIFEEYNSFQLGAGVSVVQPFGNNYLNKGLETKNIGGNFRAGINILGIYAYFNFEYNEFEVVRPDLVGYYQGSEIQTVHLMLGYPILRQDRIEVSVIAGYGEQEILNKTRNLQGSDGTLAYFQETAQSYRLGANLDYHLSGALFAYAELTYSYINTDINTSQRYEDFFGNAHLFSLNVGLKLRFRGLAIGK